MVAELIRHLVPLRADHRFALQVSYVWLLRRTAPNPVAGSLGVGGSGAGSLGVGGSGVSRSCVGGSSVGLLLFEGEPLALFGD